MTASPLSATRLRLRRGLQYAGGLALVWTIAAAIRPEVTYHLTPLLVAGAPPVAMTLDRALAPLSRALVPAAGVGLALATIVAALLATVGWLNGPAVEPFSNVLAETIAGAGLGPQVGCSWPR